MQSELGSLISRLRKRSYPDSPRVPNKEKSLLKEAKQIQSKIEIFTQDKDLAKKMHNDAVDFFSKDKMEKVDEQRDALIASFFFLNRKKIGDNLSKELAKRHCVSIFYRINNPALKEYEVIKKILSFYDLIRVIGQSYQTHLLSYYASELAHKFHNYYANNRIIQPDDIQGTKSKLLVTMLVKNMLHICLTLLGVSCPERM